MLGSLRRQGPNIVTIDKQPWFVAQDVCAALTISISRRATAALPASDAIVQQMNITKGRPPQLISETGLCKADPPGGQAVRQGPPELDHLRLE